MSGLVPVKLSYILYMVGLSEPLTVIGEGCKPYAGGILFTNADYAERAPDLPECHPWLHDSCALFPRSISLRTADWRSVGCSRNANETTREVLDYFVSSSRCRHIVRGSALFSDALNVVHELTSSIPARRILVRYFLRRYLDAVRLRSRHR